MRLITTLLLILSLPANAATFNISSSCELSFSPRGGVTSMITRYIKGAQTEILVLAYSFTSDAIADALIDAHKRGVSVSVILDSSQLTSKGSDLERVRVAGIPTYTDHMHNIMHNKVMIIDNKIFETGSFNYSNAAEQYNAENAIVCKSIQGAALYKRNWLLHQSHSIKQ